MSTKKLIIGLAACCCVLCGVPAIAAVDALGNDPDDPMRVVEADPPPAGGPAVLVDSCESPVNGNHGLAWDGTHLWVADWNTDMAYRIDISDCSVVHSIPLIGGNPNGLAWDGTYLWHADGDLRAIYQLDPVNGSVVTSYSAPGNFPVGLAFDGDSLRETDTACRFAYCTPDELHDLSTTGTVLSVSPAIGTFPTGMAFDGVYLWHSDNILDTIFKLDPDDLSVLFSFPSPGTYPNGLAWDGRYLWVDDNGTDMLYKYAVYICGDGNIDPGEECDDGNDVGGDGCAADCTIEAVITPAATTRGAVTLALIVLAAATGVLIRGRRGMTVSKDVRR